MRSEMEIITVLGVEYNHRDGTMPMSEMDWAHNAGWIEALEFVLKEEIVEKKRDISHLLEGANNDTIARSHKRLAENFGFGQKDNDVDSSNDSIRDGLLYGPQECIA